MAELRAIGWRGFDFTAAEIRSWLLAGFDVQWDMYAAALRDEGVSPEMLTREYQRFGSSEVRSLIDVVLGFIYEPAHPGDLTRLLDNWMVERVRRRKRSRAG